jgi:chemotaxis protein methyltransferase CheR
MISQEQLLRIRSTVANILGLDIKEDRLDDLERGLLETARELGINETPGDIERWLKHISWTANELDILSTHLTIGETYFFREQAWLDVFKDQIVPEIIRSRKGNDQSLRIWSAGCCSGEEPYSLAMLLKEMTPGLQGWNVNILGTDINRNFLAKAAKGNYTPWSFRETSQSRKNRFFSQTGDTWQIDPEIKNLVDFRQLNLANDKYPSETTQTTNLDVIFCRNVLMYFTPEQSRNVIRRFYQALNENGWLIVGVVEMNNQHFSDFNAVRLGSCTVYHKSPKPVQQAVIPDMQKKAKPSFAMRITPKPERRPVPFSYICYHLASITDKDEHKETELNAAKLFNKGQYEQCVSMCESILLRCPDNIEILTLLVRSKANSGLLEEAKCWAQKLASHPNVSADHYYLIANILFEKNDIESAEKILKRALYLDPHHLMSHFLLGTITNKPANKFVALKHFRNVKELLGRFEDESLVPGSDGLTAGRFRELLARLS